MNQEHLIKLSSVGKKFFNTKKNTLRIVVTDHPVEMNDGYWSGGSRSEYYGMTKSGSQVPLSYPTAPREFGGGEPTKVMPTDDMAVVQGGCFCGKTRQLWVYVNKIDGWNDPKYGVEVIK
jgi:hypothetical protein